MATQWQIEIVVGETAARTVWLRLIYEALPVVEQRLGIKKRDRARVFAELREMEDAALEVLNEA